MVAGARIAILGHEIEFMHRKWKNKKRERAKKKPGFQMIVKLAH